MRSAVSCGASGCSVEQFSGALYLSCGSQAAEWIVSRGENRQSAGVRAELRDRAANRGGNAAKQIFNLLFYGRNTLAFNALTGLLGMIAGTADGGQVVIGGGRAAFDQGGRGARAARWPSPYNPLAAAKFVPIARGSENQASKKEGGVGGLQTNTQHTTKTMSKPRCSQCGLTSTIDCMEEGCPGVAGFHPSTWARPLIQMAADLERYEALIVKLSDCMDGMTCFDECGQVARLICDEAQKIQKKRGGA